MADARRIPGPPPPPAPKSADTISLQLSIEEAVVLKALFGVVGGSMTEYSGSVSVRVHVNAISQALSKAGIEYPSFEGDKRLFDGTMAQSIVRLPAAVTAATWAHERQKLLTQQQRAIEYGATPAGPRN